MGRRQSCPTLYRSHCAVCIWASSSAPTAARPVKLVTTAASAAPCTWCDRGSTQMHWFSTSTPRCCFQMVLTRPCPHDGFHCQTFQLWQARTHRHIALSKAVVHEARRPPASILQPDYAHLSWLAKECLQLADDLLAKLAAVASRLCWHNPAPFPQVRIDGCRLLQVYHAPAGQPAGRDGLVERRRFPCQFISIRLPRLKETHLLQHTVHGQAVITASQDVAPVALQGCISVDVRLTQQKKSIFQHTAEQQGLVSAHPHQQLESTAMLD